MLILYNKILLVYSFSINKESSYLIVLSLGLDRSTCNQDGKKKSEHFKFSLTFFLLYFIGYKK